MKTTNSQDPRTMTDLLYAITKDGKSTDREALAAKVALQPQTAKQLIDTFVCMIRGQNAARHTPFHMPELVRLCQDEIEILEGMLANKTEMAG